MPSKFALLSLSIGPFAPERGSAGARRAEQAPTVNQGVCLGGPGRPVRVPHAPDLLPLVNGGNCLPFPCSDAVLAPNWVHPPELRTFLNHSTLCPRGELHCGVRGAAAGT